MNRLKKNVYLIQLLPSLVLTIFVMFISSYGFKDGIFFSYFKEPLIILYNFIPIYLFVLILSFLFKSETIGFGATSLISLLLAFTNGKKVLYRSEPLYFSDFKFIKEAFTMVKKYKVAPDMQVLIGFVLVLVLFVFLIKFFKNNKALWRFRFLQSIILTCLLFIFTNIYIFDENVYSSLGSQSNLNLWIHLDSYESKGFVYPFLHSIKSAVGYKYKDFNEKKAEEIYSTYKSKGIPDEKKVNIIAIQLESFKDFYMYRNSNLEFTHDPYKYFHDLQNESIYGQTIVNVFGGGTFYTESSVISGYRNTPTYDIPRKTYARYLTDQGYKIESSHPFVGTFYNRVNAYKSIGLGTFYDMENTFSKMSDDILFDREYFNFILDKFDENRKNGPYMSFNVSYEGHGPYNEEEGPQNEALVWNDNYTREDFNYFNNYLNLMEDTSNQLEILINHLRQVEEPTVLIFWGDHSPSMQEQNRLFKIFGINDNLATVDGFWNNYSTPYIIWANEKAKEVTGNAFRGQGPDLDPCFLFNYLFKQLGYEGDWYNQYLSDFTRNIDVIKPHFLKVNGQFRLNGDMETDKKIQEFYNMEYYRMKEKVEE